MKAARQQLVLGELASGRISVSTSGVVYTHLVASGPGKRVVDPTYAKEMSTYTDDKGYRKLSIWKEKSNAFRIHQLVWLAYRGPIPEGFEINHRDGNKFNNDISNLELVTHQQNSQHAYITGLNGNRKPVVCLDSGIIYNSMTEAAELLDLCIGNLCSVLKGNRKRVGKLRFKYLDDLDFFNRESVEQRFACAIAETRK